MTNIISLFTGAGGLDLGFTRAGFNTVWANENDKQIAHNYSTYFPNTIVNTTSITEIPNDQIPSHNITGIIGGPPCQSWSIAGAKRGINDPRGKLFYEFLRVIEHVHPAFFVVENVSGLTNKRNCEDFIMIISELEKLNYTISWEVLDAADYHVAQNRKRLFIVGYHRELGKTFTFPEPDNDRIVLKNIIGNLPLNLPNQDYSDTGFSPIFMSRNRVRNWSEPSYTILASDRHIPFHPSAPKMVKTGYNQFILKPGFEHLYRRLSVRECACIQGFPNNYTFEYNHPKIGYRMVGNAVPVELAHHIADKIFEDIIS